MKLKFLLLFFGFYSQLLYSKPDPGVESVIPDMIREYPSVRDFTLNDAHNEAYFTAQSILGEVSVIMRVDKKKGKWKKATIASFSGQYHDLEPFLSADGLKLYFASKRPNASSEQVNYDIWFVHRQSKSSKWSKPQNMGWQINSKYNEFYPSVADNNNFYFTSNKEDSKGKDDIYFSEFKDGYYQPSVSISKSVNSEGDEYNAFISRDDSYLIFGAYKRADSIGSGDLYVSYKRKDKSWSPALRLPEPINSQYMDYCPFVIGNTLYFTSRRSEFNTEKQHFKDAKNFIRQVNKYKNGMSRIYKTSLENRLPKYQSHKFPMFLIGQWKVKNKQTYEQWQLDDESNLIGISYKIENEKKHITEHVKIRKNKSDFIYSATVLDQNDGKTIDFYLKNDVVDAYVFENIEHDFPNKISYQLKSDNILYVNVSNNDGKGFSYEMVRQLEKKSETTFGTALNKGQ